MQIQLQALSYESTLPMQSSTTLISSVTVMNGEILCRLKEAISQRTWHSIVLHVQEFDMDPPPPYELEMRDKYMENGDSITASEWLDGKSGCLEVEVICTGEK